MVPREKLWYTANGCYFLEKERKRYSMRYVDFHMHTSASEDSQAPIRSMLDASAALELKAVAITDHAEMLGYREGGYDLTLQQSWRESGEVQAEYAGRLRIARGIELGEPLFDLAESERILRDHAFDFVLGSMHKLDDTDYYFYDYTHRDIGLEMDRYFDAVYDMIAWGKFHSLAHLTYPFRYMPADRRPVGYARWQERIDRLLRLLAEKGLALEINTSGMRSPGVRSMHPDLPLVRRFRELGGELITVGADAHRPEDVGTYIPEAVEVAREAGFRYIAVYFGGKPEMIPIEG